MGHKFVLFTEKSHRHFANSRSLWLLSNVDVHPWWPFAKLMLPALLNLKDLTKLTRTKQETAKITIMWHFHRQELFVIVRFPCVFFLGGVTFLLLTLLQGWPPHLSWVRKLWLKDHPPPSTHWGTSFRATWRTFGSICGKGVGCTACSVRMQRSRIKGL